MELQSFRAATSHHQNIRLNFSDGYHTLIYDVLSQWFLLASQAAVYDEDRLIFFFQDILRARECLLEKRLFPFDISTTCKKNEQSPVNCNRI